MALVRLQWASKQYRGDITALHPANLVLEDGLFTCVLGPSGSGKSTVLKLIAGIEEVSSGRIFFDDDDVTNVTPERRDVAMVFQSYALYANMTARDNIAFPLRIRGLSRNERYRRVDEVADLLDITGLLDRAPRELSGGERQRVALGRAIVRQPRVFLLDEPISNLDANLRVQMREELKRLHEALQATFIYVTHDQDDASAMGDQVVVMAAGRIHQQDSPWAVYHQPADRFVASFLGRIPMNFLRGRFRDHGDQLVFEGDGLRFTLVDPPDTFEPPDGEVLFGSRPEAVSALPADSLEGALSGRTLFTEVVPPDTYVTVVAGTHTVRARLGDTWVPAHNDQVRLHFDLTKALCFDPTTEQRIPTTGVSETFTPTERR